MRKNLERALGVLNGAVGDYLARTNNGLATLMQCMAEGEAVPIARESLLRTYPEPSSRVVLLVPGIMCTESIWDFPRSGASPLPPGAADYGALLARDLGYTPLYLRYNTGLAIPDNGASLGRLLEALVDEYPTPIEEILLLGFSMGGLVARAACHVASEQGHRWLKLVRRAIYLGTPHRGAPLERLGRVVARLLHAVDDPVTRLLAELAELRSDGVKDLGDADLRHEDRRGRQASLGLSDPKHPVALLPEIRHLLVAGTLSSERWLASLFGDSIVPLHSATDGLVTDLASRALPVGHIKVVPGLSHLELAHHPDVYVHIRAFCEEPT